MGFLEAIASRLEIMASRLEANASKLEANTNRLEAIASRWEAIASSSRLEAIASWRPSPLSSKPLFFEILFLQFFPSGLGVGLHGAALRATGHGNGHGNGSPRMRWEVCLDSRL